MLLQINTLSMENSFLVFFLSMVTNCMFSFELLLFYILGVEGSIPSLPPMLHQFVACYAVK